MFFWQLNSSTAPMKVAVSGVNCEQLGTFDQFNIP
jgi:hypothetical protein